MGLLATEDCVPMMTSSPLSGTTAPSQPAVLLQKRPSVSAHVRVVAWAERHSKRTRGYQQVR